MRYFMLQPYKEIPQYAEVEVIDTCRDSGYECYLVKYNGEEYKPLEKDVISEKSIIDNAVYYFEKFNYYDFIKSKCLGHFQKKD